ncbi:MAG TPA: kelch repeat-containing protein, partial [Flavipsychrobacter sp.]|nr:kelch repeat-containing protein [Flavipsychrobacter sp.]
MNKQVFHFFLLLLLSTNAALAQNYEWTWMHGYNRPALYPDYGTQGVASSSNIPGGREGAVYWTDASGKFWLFGGNGYPQNRTNALNLNDLWKFDPATGQWTWMKGDVGDVTHGVYGTQGVANAANKPGKRHSAMGWRDAAGNLWLFGGNGYASTGGTGRLNDLWKYDIGTNMWTWIDGDNIINQHGVYGTLGTSAATNKPGGRTGAATWVDATGDLWLFGGNGYATAGGANVLNDLWRYDIVSGEWTWMAGANTTTQFGVYGTLGVSDANNKPGAREGAVAWTDNTGNLWLLGGIGLTTSAIGRLNDLWKFDIATGEWTWMNGDNTTNQLGIYGTLGTSSATNKPGARCYAICWKDASGDFWIFGGDGFASVGGNSMLSDLWKYDVSANEWTWMKGPDVSGQYAVYGTQGVANAANTPGGK